MLIESIKTAQLIICVGAGGVGKTSVSAALGLMAANLGRKTLILTIDPAQRLAGALGIENALNEPTQVAINPLLFAMMFDVEKGWQRLLTRELGERFFQSNLQQNRFFKHLANELPGSHEFIACDEVYDLLNSKLFDLIVLDTPPSAQGIQFLTAPQSLVRFFENELFTSLIRSKSVLSKVSFGLSDRGAGLIKRGLNHFVESSFIDEMFDFIHLLRDLYPVMSRRAKAFQQVLSSESAEFVIIARPNASTLEDASELSAKLRELHYRGETIILNQVSPNFAVAVKHEDMSLVFVRELQRAQLESDLWEEARSKHFARHSWLTIPRLISRDQPLERIARMAQRLQYATHEEARSGH